MDNNMKIAVLVDGDNAQPKLLQDILEEVSRYGKVTIRRIYGDWTDQRMSGWKDKLNQHSFNPIQKFSYTTGKNSTDSSLIIDAMDILHNMSVDGFCLVSSDSDYTGLAKRIREEGMFVMGIGERKTPAAFVQSCEIFTYTETIIAGESMISDADESHEEENGSKIKKKNSRAARPAKKDSPSEEPKSRQYEKLNKKMIDRAFDISVGENGTAHISTVGWNLRKIDPSFDPRNHGFRNLTQLFSSLKKYVVIQSEETGFNPVVRLK